MAKLRSADRQRPHAPRNPTHQISRLGLLSYETRAPRAFQAATAPLRESDHPEGHSPPIHRELSTDASWNRGAP